MKNLLLFLFFIPINIFSQSTCLTGVTYNRPLGVVYDMGDKGVAIMGGVNQYGRSHRLFSPVKSETIVRIDTKGKLMWDKSFDIPSQKKSLGSFFGSSADGNDIYILSFEDYGQKSGYSGAILTHVDIDGKANSKRYDDYKDNFGQVLTMYANSKYFFVMTSAHDYYETEPSKNQYKLYRFDKQTLEMKLLDDELTKVNPDFKSAWEMIHVTDAGVTGYRVMSSQDQTITLELATFDNDGKKIAYKSNDITLTAFPRKTSCRINYPAGICKGDYSLNITTTMDQAMITREIIREPEAWCNMIYDNINDRYLAYGMTGPQKQKTLATIFDGFFIQQFSSDFTLGKKAENNTLNDLIADKKISRDDTPDERKMALHLNPNGILLVNFHSFDGGKHIYIIDANTFEVKKHVNGSDTHSIYSVEPEASIANFPEVEKYDNDYPRPKDQVIFVYEYDSDNYADPVSFDTRYGQLLIYQDKTTHALTCFWSEKTGQ